jgi:uncharacterized metal-binding protein YceD (DUF177 family)
MPDSYEWRMLCARCLRAKADGVYGHGNFARTREARTASEAVTVMDGDAVCMIHAIEKIDLSRSIARVKGRDDAR